jgi:ASC-1-like (ASCH) protein
MLILKREKLRAEVTDVRKFSSNEHVCKKFEKKIENCTVHFSPFEV